MMYPFLVLDDGTEIVHSDVLADGRVKVYLEWGHWFESSIDHQNPLEKADFLLHIA